MGIHKEFVSKAILTFYLHRSHIIMTLFLIETEYYSKSIFNLTEKNYFRHHTNTIELNSVATLLLQYKLTETASLWRNCVLR